MSVLDPQPLDQLRSVTARLGELLAHPLTERRREGIHLPDRGLVPLLHRGYQSSGRRAGLCPNSDTSGVERVQRLIEWFKRHRVVLIVIQVAAVAVILFFLGWAFRGAWQEAKPLLREADLREVAISTLVLISYYLLFTVAWQRILAAWGLQVPYFVALQAEMASILAKYVPGTVWIPAARVAALRRHGYRDTPLVLGSMIMEAGLSALAGIIVFFVSLTTVGFRDAPVLPLLVLALIAVVGLHPRVFTPGVRRVLRPFGASNLPPLPYPTLLGLLAFYCFTWLVGGTADLLPAALARGEPIGHGDPVPRRCGRGLGDRRLPLADHALGARRARGVDVRAAAGGDDEGRRARRDGAEPADDHDRRGCAAARGGARLAVLADGLHPNTGPSP